MLETIGYVLAGLFIVLAPGVLFSIALWPENSMSVWSRIGASVCLGFMLLLYITWALASVGSLFFHTTFLAAAGVSIGLFVASLLRGGEDLMEAYVRGALKVLGGAVAKMRAIAGRLKPPKKPAPPPPPEIPKPEAVPPPQPQELPKPEAPPPPPESREPEVPPPPPESKQPEAVAPPPEKQEGQPAEG